MMLKTFDNVRCDLLQVNKMIIRGRNVPPKVEDIFQTLHCSNILQKLISESGIGFFSLIFLKNLHLSI